MADISAIFFILLMLGVAFPAMLTAWWLLFPNLIQCAQTRVDKSPGATFWLGLIVVIALILPIFILMALPFGPAKSLGWILLGASLAFSSIGFISEYRKASIRPRRVTMDEQDADLVEDDLVSLLNRQSDEFLRWWATPETEVANRLLGEQIMAAIEELPESFRETILLVNVDGLGYDEAAAVLGVPAGTVRSRMKRGRTFLQKALWAQARDAGLISDREPQP